MKMASAPIQQVFFIIVLFHLRSSVISFNCLNAVKIIIYSRVFVTVTIKNDHLPKKRYSRNVNLNRSPWNRQKTISTTVSRMNFSSLFRSFLSEYERFLSPVSTNVSREEISFIFHILTNDIYRYHIRHTTVLHFNQGECFDQFYADTSI